MYAASGHLLFARQCELFAQQFDPKRLALEGAAFRIAGRVWVNQGVSLASLSASAAGAVAYGTGADIHSQFVWLDRAGNRVAPWGAASNSLVAAPALSPDSRRLAFGRVVAGNWDLWLMDTRGALSRLTSDPALDFFPIWSGDGRRIIFASTRGASTDLYSKIVDDASAEELLFKSAQSKTPTDVSADGRFVLFTSSDPSTGADIWALPLTGNRTPRPFVQSRFDEGSGQFSPDGKWVAYQSTETGKAEVYLQPFPGPGDRTRVSTDGGQQPRWGRRGQELFYVAGDQWLTTVPVKTDPAGRSVIVGAASRLFRMRLETMSILQQYIVSEDGQRFLMNAPTDSAEPPSIVVILNWKGKP